MLKRGIRSKLRRVSPAALREAWNARADEVLLVDWVGRGPAEHNWGDAIAPHLVRRLSGRPVVNRRDVLNLAGKPVYTTIGSMMGTIDTPKAEVWGTGFVDSTSTLLVPPARVHAVRGPRTRQKLLEAGVECPEVYGDPALLTPLFWPAAPEKRFRLGIIPHFRDTALPAAQRFAGMDDVQFIDIEGGIERVVQQVTECETIATGSLHGLVCADAFGIPATWIQFSTNAYGDGFKFRDYLDSTGDHRHLDPLEIHDTTTLAEIEDRFVPHRLDVDLEQFLDACPFLDRSQLPSPPPERDA